MRYSLKKEYISYVFYCFENLSIDFGTTGPIQVGFSAKYTSPKEDFRSLMRLPTDSPVDRITNYW